MAADAATGDSPAADGQASRSQAQAGPSSRRLVPVRTHGWTTERQASFFTLLAKSLNVRQAAASVGLTARSAYQLRKRDTDFARRWVLALDHGYADLEQALMSSTLDCGGSHETAEDGRAVTPGDAAAAIPVPKGQGIRLLTAHRAEVQAFRLAHGGGESDEAIAERLRHHMDIVRARLLDGTVQNVNDMEGTS